ncbi:MAG TPA: hypothetical protein VHD56_14640 [Tepidisphaeraceae bacterium]|nr:hypothetical protein [Tepidisphaeraceae bacterium]
MNGDFKSRGPVGGCIYNRNREKRGRQANLHHHNIENSRTGRRVKGIVATGAI